MKYYQMEREAQEFMKHAHTLKEWNAFGFNKCVYNGHDFADGYWFDGTRITDDEDKEFGLLELDYFDYDDDNFMYVVLKKAEK